MITKEGNYDHIRADHYDMDIDVVYGVFSRTKMETVKMSLARKRLRGIKNGKVQKI